MGFGVGKSELVQDTENHGINHCLNGCRPTIKGGDGRQNQCACFHDRNDIAGVDQTPWGFPGNKDELAAFFEEDVRGTQQCAVACASGNASDGPH